MGGDDAEPPGALRARQAAIRMGIYAVLDRRLAALEIVAAGQSQMRLEDFGRNPNTVDVTVNHSGLFASFRGLLVDKTCKLMYESYCLMIGRYDEYSMAHLSSQSLLPETGESNDRLAVIAAARAGDSGAG